MYSKESVQLFLVYGFGYMSGFHTWFTIIQPDLGDLFWGSQSFAGVFRAVGVDVTNNYVIFDKVVHGNLVTNVDSALRDFVLDFGIIGSIIFFGVSIAVSNGLQALANRYGLLLQAFNFCILCSMLWIFVNPFFTYTTLVIGSVVFIVYVSLTQVYEKKY